MNRTISLVSALAGLGLLVAPAASGQSSDAYERAVAHSSSGTAVQPDAFERAVASGQRSAAIPTDAHQRTGTSTRPTALASRSTFPPDAFERILQNRSGVPGAVALGDHNARMDAPVSQTEPLGGLTSRGDIAWMEGAIGFALGIVLALGLYGARRATLRELAH